MFRCDADVKSRRSGRSESARQPGGAVETSKQFASRGASTYKTIYADAHTWLCCSLTRPCCSGLKEAEDRAWPYQPKPLELGACASFALSRKTQILPTLPILFNTTLLQETQEHISIMASQTSARDANNELKNCAGCHLSQKTAGRQFQTCSRCKGARYCSRECQKSDVKLLSSRRLLWP